jgi:hypothetical protein
MDFLNVITDWFPESLRPYASYVVVGVAVIVLLLVLV